MVGQIRSAQTRSCDTFSEAETTKPTFYTFVHRHCHQIAPNAIVGGVRVRAPTPENSKRDLWLDVFAPRKYESGHYFVMSPEK